jgi:hypothetical protein
VLLLLLGSLNTRLRKKPQQLQRANARQQQHAKQQQPVKQQHELQSQALQQQRTVLPVAVWVALPLVLLLLQRRHRTLRLMKNGGNGCGR